MKEMMKLADRQPKTGIIYMLPKFKKEKESLSMMKREIKEKITNGTCRVLRSKISEMKKYTG